MNFIFKFISSNISNILSFISLAVGIVSLIVTLLTYKKATAINEAVNKAKAQAINNMDFKQNKDDILNNLNSSMKNLNEKSNDVFSVIQLTLYEYIDKLMGYNLEWRKDDICKITAFHRYMEELFNKPPEKVNTDVVRQELTKYIIETKTIIERGEYL